MEQRREPLPAPSASPLFLADVDNNVFAVASGVCAAASAVLRACLARAVAWLASPAVL